MSAYVSAVGASVINAHSADEKCQVKNHLKRGTVFVLAGSSKKRSDSPGEDPEFFQSTVKATTMREAAEVPDTMSILTSFVSGLGFSRVVL